MGLRFQSPCSELKGKLNSLPLFYAQFEVQVDRKKSKSIILGNVKF